MELGPKTALTPINYRVFRIYYIDLPCILSYDIFQKILWFFLDIIQLNFSF